MIRAFMVLSLFLASFMGSMSFTTTQASAQNFYGAIAYSPSSRVYGYSFDYRSRAAAEDRAYAECNARGPGCITVLWFRNACGALATGPNGYGSGWGTTLRLARRQALRGCRRHSSNCKVIRWACTTR